MLDEDADVAHLGLHVRSPDISYSCTDGHGGEGKDKRRVSPRFVLHLVL
jgi:hypothetical protein